MQTKKKMKHVAVTLLVLICLVCIFSVSMADNPFKPSMLTTAPSVISSGVMQDMPLDQISEHDIWCEIFSEFNDSKDEMLSQLNDAKFQYPELVLAFKSTAAYSNFLELRVRNLSRYIPNTETAELPQVMDLDHRFRIGVFPPDICPPNPYPTPKERWGVTLDELREWIMEEKLERIKDKIGLFPTCDDIRDDYKETLEKLESLYQQTMLTAEQIDEMYQCVEKLQRLTNALIENGCITEYGEIVDPNYPG